MQEIYLTQSVKKGLMLIWIYILAITFQLNQVVHVCGLNSVFETNIYESFHFVFAPLIYKESFFNEYPVANT